MHNLLVFLATYVFIFLKAFQQRNVQHNDFLLVPGTSMLMAVVEYYVIAVVAMKGYGWELVLCGGLGAGLGAMSAMWVHNRHLDRKNGKNA